MSDQLVFDEDASRRIEEIYGTPDVVEQRRRVLAALDLRPGERVLDVGCGPGLLAAQMAQAVGPGGHVRGIDVSVDMLSIAARRDAGPQAAPIAVGEGEATALPVPDTSLEVVVATQVYEYVADIAGALAEARRALVPGGRLLVLDTDWDSIVWRSRDDGRMARVLEAWDEHLAHRDLPRRLPQLLREAGLTLDRCDVVPILNVGDDRDTYSGGMRELIATFVPGRRGVDARETEVWAEDLRTMGADYFFSLSRYLFTATR